MCGPVAPHHTVDRRAQPPVVPRAAVDGLDLTVESLRLFRLRTLPVNRPLDVDICEAVDDCHDVGAQLERCSSAGKHVAVTRRIDDRAGQNRLATRLCFEDAAAERAILDQRVDERRM